MMSLRQASAILLIKIALACRRLTFLFVFYATRSFAGSIQKFVRPELLAEQRLPVEARRRGDGVVVDAERLSAAPDDAVVIADQDALGQGDEPIEGRDGR